MLSKLFFSETKMRQPSANIRYCSLHSCNHKTPGWGFVEVGMRSHLWQTSWALANIQEWRDKLLFCLGEIANCHYLKTWFQLWVFEKLSVLIWSNIVPVYDKKCTSLQLVCRMRCTYPSFPRRRKLRFLEGEVCHSTPGTLFENNLDFPNYKKTFILDFLLLQPTMDGHISYFGFTFSGELDAEEVYSQGARGYLSVAFLLSADTGNDKITLCLQR